MLSLQIPLPYRYTEGTCGESGSLKAWFVMVFLAYLFSFDSEEVRAWQSGIVLSTARKQGLERFLPDYRFNCHSYTIGDRVMICKSCKSCISVRFLADRGQVGIEEVKRKISTMIESRTHLSQGVARP